MLTVPRFENGAIVAQALHCVARQPVAPEDQEGLSLYPQLALTTSCDEVLVQYWYAVPMHVTLLPRQLIYSTSKGSAHFSKRRKSSQCKPPSPHTHATTTPHTIPKEDCQPCQQQSSALSEPVASALPTNDPCMCNPCSHCSPSRYTHGGRDTGEHDDNPRHLKCNICLANGSTPPTWSDLVWVWSDKDQRLSKYSTRSQVSRHDIAKTLGALDETTAERIIYQLHRVGFVYSYTIVHEAHNHLDTAG